MHEPRPLLAEKPITFSGERGTFERLVARGTMLELVTLGFYRFWLATDMRRHLWSNTAVEGDAAEYTGTPKELLVGFLFALAILLPLYAAYFYGGIIAESWQEYASFPLVIAFFLFTRFARYRALRYRLSRTVWRGMRFNMSGSGLGYVARYAGWTLLAIVTLGVALPWRKAALERYKLGNTSYGTLQGGFVGTGGDLLAQVWRPLILALTIIIVAGLFFFTPIWILTTPSALFALASCYATYKAAEWRWWLAGLRLGNVRFESELPRGALEKHYWKAVGWCALLFAGFIAWVAIVMAVAVMAGEFHGTGEKMVAGIATHVAFLGLIGFGYVAAMLTAGAFIRIHVLRGVWSCVASSTTVVNIGEAESMLAEQRLVTAVGEGFADSFELAGFAA
jgi:uncharacterized membrane protein YjgN (DUF898 family)